MSVSQLQHCDAERPDVCQGIVPLRLLHDLRRHPAGGAHKGVAPAGGKPPGSIALQGGCHPEVRQQHIPIVVHKDVARLHITVNAVMPVHVVQALEDLPKNHRNDRLFQPLWIRILHDVEHGAARDVGLNHPKVLLVHEGHVKYQHIGVVEQPHCLSLLHDVIQAAIHGLQVHELNRHNLIERLAHSSPHSGTDATSALLKQLVGIRGCRVILACVQVCSAWGPAHSH
mmetsp:Transcript_9413/g.28314  ORF Transcript_9413/g.28314 Transcript_9413/m.28314 type:complete len:228 (-) Transcript_9413:217-900(-)